MFIWTGISRNVGIVHVDRWGDINGHKTLPLETARSLYNSLLDQGAKLASDCSHQKDYQHTIKWLLGRI